MTDQWVAPHADRGEPDRIAAERIGLDQWLDFHRATLLRKCAGLTADQLKRRPVPPSGLSLLGLVRHMTEVEQWWFRMHAGGEHGLPWPYDSDQDGSDFSALDGADAEENLRAFAAEVEAAKAAVSGMDLDDVVPGPPGFGDRPPRDIRWIYLHMIEEYARHNGHADLLREAIDGATGD